MQWFLFTRQERNPRMRSFDDVKPHGAKRAISLVGIPLAW
jgi:hypothetical protein